MADISQYLQAIMSAVYGEDVRGSIHDAIALINDVGEAVLTLGTAVDSPTSPTTGFYQDSVYLNTATGDMWTCTGTGWSLSGNTKGDQGDPGLAATIDVGTVTGGTVASVTNSGTTSAAVFDFVLPKGDKGDTGDGLTAESEHSGSNTIVSIKNTTTQTVVDTFNVPDGVPGATGNGIASIAKTATAGLVDTYTITYTDGTSTTFTVTNGQDGQGAGDMTKVAYDPTNAVADAGGIPAYVSAHGGTTYTGEKGVIVAGTTIKAALVNDTASSLASQTISATQNRQYAVNLDNNSKLSVNVPWENTTYNPATTSANGLMSSTDKSKLDGLDAVVANPAGSPTDDLTSIQIGSTVYRLQGGGTTIVQIPSVVGDTFTYNGISQGPTITGLDTTHCTVTGATAINAGSYTLTIALNDPSSMVWSDLTTADKTYSYTIAKASQTLTASKNSVSLTTAQPSDTVTISGQQTSLTVSSSDTGVATVSESSGVVTITGVGGGSATVSVYAEGTANYEQSATISISVTMQLKPSLVAWSSGTDAQISDIINGYYDGALTLQEIQSVWSVGDVRNVGLTAITASGGSGDTAWSVGESHQAQTIRLEIIDFEHDTLKSPINGKTKALVTVDMKDCFNYTNYVNNGNNNTENGYIDSSASKNWSTCARRQWCKNAFVNALPTYLKDIVKTVSKPTRENGDSNTEINLDETAFLLSCKELANYGSLEGTQYAYYANATANQYKLPKADSQGNTVCCVVWTKSSYSSGFQFMNRIGSIDGTTATLARGLFVGFCL